MEFTLLPHVSQLNTTLKSSNVFFIQFHFLYQLCFLLQNPQINIFFEFELNQTSFYLVFIPGNAVTLWLPEGATSAALDWLKFCTSVYLNRT